MRKTSLPRVYFERINRLAFRHAKQALRILRLAAEAADLAENLPEGAAIIVVAARVAREEEHLADLLIRICLARTN